MARRADPRRRPGPGEQPLPAAELENPDYRLDRDYAGFSINEARKPEHHGLKIDDFNDLVTKAGEARKKQFTAFWLGDIILSPPNPKHPAVVEYKQSPKARTIYRMALSSTEAIFLGRDPALFGLGAAEAAQQRIADMQHPEFETIPDPPERWRILQTYIDESIQPKISKERLLYGASRYRNSNGEAAERKDRLSFVQFVREQVIHPLLDDATRAAGWDDRNIELAHRVTDWRLFFEGRYADRDKEWRHWHVVARGVLEDKKLLFARHVEEAKEQPQEVMIFQRPADSAAGAVQ